MSLSEKENIKQFGLNESATKWNKPHAIKTGRKPARKTVHKIIYNTISIKHREVGADLIPGKSDLSDIALLHLPEERDFLWGPADRVNLQESTAGSNIWAFGESMFDVCKKQLLILNIY